jgi:hypothetical protein
MHHRFDVRSDAEFGDYQQIAFLCALKLAFAPAHC